MSWYVYVLQSQQRRYGKRGRPLPGFHYVGCTTDPVRRLKQHNGLLVGGGKYTSKHRPWRMQAIFGSYANQSEAMKAERALKRGKRGAGRTRWSPKDSKWCRGLGVDDPRVAEINALYTSAPVASPAPEGSETPKGAPDGTETPDIPK